MMQFVKHRMLGTVLTIAVASTAFSASALDKDAVIRDRQAFMKDQIRQWLVVRNFIQGKADQAQAISAVISLTKSVPMVPDHFPPGTAGPSPDGKFGTKPEVWSQHDKFLAANKKVSDQVAVLAAAVKSGDKAKTEAAFKELDACNACHQDFRAKLQ